MCGAGGSAGQSLERLWGVVAPCADRWSLDLGYAVECREGRLLLRARRRGEPVVLQVDLSAEPGASHHEADLLRAAAGAGYLRLLDEDREHGALLLETFGSTMGHQIRAHPSGADHMLLPIGETLQRAWTLPVETVVEVDEHTHAGAVRAAAIRDLAHRAGLPQHQAAVERALAYTAQRLEDRNPARQVVVHGDPGPHSLVSLTTPRPGAESGYVLTGPLGFRCEREFDLGTVVREANRAILHAEDSVVTVRRWCARLADVTDTDAEAVWQWALIERVWTGLRHVVELGRPAEGGLYLQTASWLITRRL